MNDTEVAEATPTTTEEEQPQPDMDMEKALEELKEALIKEGEKSGLDRATIEMWKDNYKRVGAFPIGDIVYFVRPLSRLEWRQLNQQQADAQNNPMIELDVEEKIALMATLHPKIDEPSFRTASFAGLATTIAQAVHNMSDFQPGVQAIIL